jgi:hypothetical protein
MYWRSAVLEFPTSSTRCNCVIAAEQCEDVGGIFSGGPICSSFSLPTPSYSRKALQIIVTQRMNGQKSDTCSSSYYYETLSGRRTMASAKQYGIVILGNRGVGRSFIAQHYVRPGRLR